ncbi:MAG: bile acid:sodium symporter family protein [Bacteriovoracaceae bacterium]
METSVIIGTVLPLSLGFIMFGFGLSLTTDDFARVLKQPKSVLIGLGCQMFILPLIAFFICKIFQLPPETAVGVMILSASPGGIAANLFSHLSHGDIALNLTLTAINSVLSAFTLPLVANLALAYFISDDKSIGLQFKKTIEVFMIVLVPVALGMTVKNFKPNFAKKMDKPVRIFSVLFLVLIIVGAIAKEKEQLISSFVQIGGAMLLFNLSSMLIGYALPLLLKLRHQEATAIAMEVGIHNSTLSMYVALALLGSVSMAIPSAIYSIIMFMTAGVFSYILSKKNKLS